jgi:hypothetical protein
MKDMDNLRLSRGVHAIDDNSATLDNKETLTGVLLREKGFPLLSSLITLENELILVISGGRSPSKICERSREF